MKINLIILTVIFLTLGSWALYQSHKPPQFQPIIENENRKIEYLTAPDFKYTDINNLSGHLYDAQGRVVLLHFWATWCAPCLVEFPELIALAEKMKNNLTILAVSTDHDISDIERFIKNTKLTIPDNVIIIHDGDKTITQDLYQTFKLPETYLIDKESRIREKLIGPQEGWDSDTWIERIKSIR